VSLGTPQCPKCGKENEKPAREWVGGLKGSKPMKVQRFMCSFCGTSYVAWRDSETGELKTMTRKG
jgi:transposase-like protein